MSMKLDSATLASWTMIAATFGLALFVIASPTGSFVELAMDYGAREKNGVVFVASQVPAADPEARVASDAN